MIDLRSSANLLRLLVLPLVVIIGGCEKLETQYGGTQGREAYQSIAGFGVMRQYFRNRQWDDRTIVRLSERQQKLNTIVYIPTFPKPLSQPAVDWFDNWLATSDKTLVYILQDDQIVDAYWKASSRLAPPNERLEYRRRSARADLEKQRERLSRSSPLTEGWFTYVPRGNPPLYHGWSDLTKQQNPAERTVVPLQMPRDLSWQLRAYSAASDSSPQAIPARQPNWISLGQGVSQSRTQVEPWITTETGQPLVLRVSSPDWPGSQIFVVASGSLMTNLGLLDPACQALLADLEQWTFEEPSGEVRKIGFLTAGESGVNVTSLSDAALNTSGMEAFTTWPLNIVSLHLAAVGFIVCLMLFPVLGRPRRLFRQSQSDFADHLKAVAALMARTSGEDYARVRISEYMVRVRGETTGPWVIPIPGPTPVGPSAEGLAGPEGLASIPADPSPTSPAMTSSNQAIAPAVTPPKSIDASPPQSLGQAEIRLPAEPPRQAFQESSKPSTNPPNEEIL